MAHQGFRPAPRILWLGILQLFRQSTKLEFVAKPVRNQKAGELPMHEGFLTSHQSETQADHGDCDQAGPRVGVSTTFAVQPDRTVRGNRQPSFGADMTEIGIDVNASSFRH